MFTLNWKAVCCWNSSMALVYKTVLFETVMLSFGIFNNSHKSNTSLKRVRSCTLDCWHSWHIHWPVFDWRLQLVIRCAQSVSAIYRDTLKTALKQRHEFKGCLTQVCSLRTCTIMCVFGWMLTKGRTCRCSQAVALYVAEAWLKWSWRKSTVSFLINVCGYTVDVIVKKKGAL